MYSVKTMRRGTSYELEGCTCHPTSLLARRSRESWPRSLARTGIQFLATGWAYFAFLLACDVGLHISAAPEEFATRRTMLTAIVLASALVGGALLALASSRLSRRLPGSRRRLAGVVGAVTTVAVAPLAALYVLLLSSSTWGSLAGSDYAMRNEYVSAVRPAWLWWFLTLITLLVLHSLFGSALRSDARSGRIVTRVCYVLVPVTIIAAMVTLSLQTPS